METEKAVETEMRQREPSTSRDSAISLPPALSGGSERAARARSAICIARELVAQRRPPHPPPLKRWGGAARSHGSWPAPANEAIPVSRRKLRLFPGPPRGRSPLWWVGRDGAENGRRDCTCARSHERTNEGRSAGRRTGCDAGPRAAGAHGMRRRPCCGGYGERRMRRADKARDGRKERPPMAGLSLSQAEGTDGGPALARPADLGVESRSRDEVRANEGGGAGRRCV